MPRSLGRSARGKARDDGKKKSKRANDDGKIEKGRKIFAGVLKFTASLPRFYGVLTFDEV